VPFAYDRLKQQVQSPFISAFDSAELCVRLLNGDSSAESEFVTRFLPRVRSMIAARTGDREATQDLGQQVMLNAICSLRQQMPRNPDLLGAFVFGVTRNIVNGYFRDQTRHRMEDLAATETITDSAVLSRERGMIEDARHEIEKLDPADRQVLRLTLSEGMEPAEIAVKLRIPAATVRQRKSRAIQRLKDRLSRGGPPNPLSMVIRKPPE
jgi:RNA polymerase sigma factor (sigma-70 family)